VTRTDDIRVPGLNDLLMIIEVIVDGFMQTVDNKSPGL
jgi:hypothetical protein